MVRIAGKPRPSMRRMAHGLHAVCCFYWRM